MTISCCSVVEAPLTTNQAEEVAARFKALADPARVRLFSLIVDRGDVCACDLVDPIGLSQPTVSHHLKVLYEAGLIDRRRQGRWIHYTPNPEGVEALRASVA